MGGEGMTPTAEMQSLKVWASARFQEGRSAAVHGVRRRLTRGGPSEIGVGDDFFDFGHRVGMIEEECWGALEDAERREREIALKWLFGVALAPGRALVRRVRLLFMRLKHAHRPD